MPKPSKGESKKDYVSRCIPIVIGEGKPPKEAAGKCYGMYDFYKKKSKKKKSKKNESLISLPKFSEFITETTQSKDDKLQMVKDGFKNVTNVTLFLAKFGSTRFNNFSDEKLDDVYNWLKKKGYIVEK